MLWQPTREQKHTTGKNLKPNNNYEVRVNTNENNLDVNLIFAV